MFVHHKENEIVLFIAAKARQEEAGLSKRRQTQKDKYWIFSLNMEYKNRRSQQKQGKKLETIEGHKYWSREIVKR